MTDVFGQTYAGAYDLIYRAKDYEGEVDLVERILAREGKGGARRILDLGCGTGNHALPLARRGHSVVGVDLSSSMLDQACDKASNAASPDFVKPTYRQGDIRTVEAGGGFDAVIMMFAVLCYLHTDNDVLAAMANVRRQLVPGGLFIFDVWNGLAVLADEPKGRHISITEGQTRIDRQTRTQLDLANRLCNVHFNLKTTGLSGSTDTADEEHIVRFYFEAELRELLMRSGLELLSLRGFPDEGRPPDDKEWNIIGVARA